MATNLNITKVLDILKSAFSFAREPLTPLPPQLLLTGANLRPGLSAIEIASRIISRQSEAGAPVGNVFADGQNISEKMELIRVQEIINALLLEAKIEIVIPPGIQVTAVGANAGGPIVVQGTTTNIAAGSGVIR